MFMICLSHNCPHEWLQTFCGLKKEQMNPILVLVTNPGLTLHLQCSHWGGPAMDDDSHWLWILLLTLQDSELM